MEFKEKLYRALSEAGLSADGTACETFTAYAGLLLKWNKKMNLTAITDEDGIIYKHFLDSLLPCKYIVPGGRLIDVGTGAGFPGIPLKILYPHIELTLLDSLKKRVSFLTAAVEELGLSSVEIIWARAEEGAKKENLRESFDMAVSRAVARLGVLSEYCLPYVKPGGVFISYKGSEIEAELSEAAVAIEKLGGKIARVEKTALYDGDFSRSLVFIDKIGRTPSIYPRSSGLILKKPLI